MSVEPPCRYLNISLASDKWNSFDPCFLDSVVYTILKELCYDEYLFEICLYLTDDAEITQLNLMHRSVHAATNVLAFEGDFNLSKTYTCLLGSIAISYDYCHNEANELKISFKNHITNMFVHGMFHLLGYDHINDEDFLKMKNMEQKILSILDLYNPYYD